MKTFKSILATLIALVTMQIATAQNGSIAILTLDKENLDMTKKELGEIARIEIDKLGKYNVIDRYEVREVCEANDIDIENCFSRSCIADAGKLLKADKMLTGSVQRLSDYMFVDLRIIDVTTGKIEKSHVIEFRPVPSETRTMIRLTMEEMLGLPVDIEVKNNLVRLDSYETLTNNPDALKVTHGGPRMGVSSVTGQALKVMQAPRSQGGFDMMPFMTQIGYQFEQQYLNRGRFQAVFEFVPMVSGLEQGKFIPSFNVLNGFRDAKSGIEFAMGPSINFLRMANGYFDEDGEWHLESEWEYYTYDPITYESTYNENPHDIVKRLDSRGVPALQSGFVFAIGKTFRSGHLNIPVNLWVKPQKGGTFYGATFGFNIMEHKKAKNEFKP